MPWLTIGDYATILLTPPCVSLLDKLEAIIRKPLPIITSDLLVVEVEFIYHLTITTHSRRHLDGGTEEVGIPIAIIDTEESWELVIVKEWRNEALAV